MRNKVSLFILPAIALGVACTQPVNTVPPPVTPTDAVQYYDLQIPSELDIRTIDFSATTFADVNGPPEGATTSSVGGRAFVRVHAVHRTTGEHYLLLYEDVAHRRRPVQIVRFVPSAVRAKPDTAR